MTSQQRLYFEEVQERPRVRLSLGFQTYPAPVSTAEGQADKKIIIFRFFLSRFYNGKCLGTVGTATNPSATSSKSI